MIHLMEHSYKCNLCLDGSKIISITDHQNEIDKICDNNMNMKVTWAFVPIMPHTRFTNYGINTSDKDVITLYLYNNFT